jgi:hypothetical protein
MNRKALGLGLSLMLACSVWAVGQQPVQSDRPDRADVLKFLNLMHAREQMVQVMAGMSKQMKTGAEESFKDKVPDATPEQLAKVDKIVDSIMASIPVDDMVDAIVPIYQKHLTRDDLAAITAFYGSPAGQKLLKELPAIMSEAMVAGGEIGRKAVAGKSDEIERQMADLVRDSVKKQ